MYDKLKDLKMVDKLSINIKCIAQIRKNINNILEKGEEKLKIIIDNLCFENINDDEAEEKNDKVILELNDKINDVLEDNSDIILDNVIKDYLKRK